MRQEKNLGRGVRVAEALDDNSRRSFSSSGGIVGCLIIIDTVSGAAPRRSQSPGAFIRRHTREEKSSSPRWSIYTSSSLFYTRPGYANNKTREEKWGVHDHKVEGPRSENHITK